MSGQAGNEINSDDHIIIISQYYHQERKDELGFHPQIAGSANASAQRLPELLKQRPRATADVEKRPEKKVAPGGGGLRACLQKWATG